MNVREIENQTEDPLSSTIQALFEKQAALTPAAVAIEFQDRRLTYGELDQQASRVAFRLRRLGIVHGTPVGLCMERSPEMIVGMLGILKAGGAYVPLDSAEPDRRLSFMIKDSGAPVIVAHLPTASRLAPSLRQAKVLWIERDDAVGDELGASKPVARVAAPELACVIYTSGPMGCPQGVLIGHRAVAHMVFNSGIWRCGSNEVVLQLAPIASEDLNFEVWGTLLTGGRLAMMPPRCAALDGLGRAIERHGVTTLRLDSGAFHLIAEQRPDDLRPLRQLVVDGGPISPFHVQTVLHAMRGGAIVKVYGSAESTTVACCHRITSGDRIDGTIPIGQPISNTTIHVLDAEMKPVQPGSTGQVWVGGDGLALGYLNHPALTRQKFIADPFVPQPGGRLYRTGDLVCRHSDGHIELVGRVDNRVNIAGRRIEPGEVEAVLRRHPDVHQTVVVGGAGPRGEQRLVAYVVRARPGMISADELTDYLGRRLARYMIPSVFMPIDALPRARDGKVDRASLPPPDLLEHLAEALHPLKTEMDQSIRRRPLVVQQ